ncbi:MAG: CDP-diacylglycerol--serine O-phosphatidyltransferase [Bacteroidales bacterium]
MIKQIPNLITLLNLLSGSIGLVFIYEGHLEAGSLMILAGAFFDFMDGMAARLLKVTSDIGKDLDSLADVVTFGVLPGMILYRMISDQATGLSLNEFWKDLLPFTALLIPVFSAIRLARFNNDTRQTFHFRGLPTPANALFISTLPFILNLPGSALPFQLWIRNWISSPVTLLILTPILAWLLISDLPLLSLKFKSLSFKGHEAIIVLLLSGLILLVWLGVAASVIILLLYLLISIAALRNER